MRSTFTRLIIVFFGLLTGCSQQLQRDTCVMLSDNIRYCLADIPSDTASNTYSQYVSIEHQGKRHQLLTEFALTPQQMKLVGLAPIGQPLFTIVYDCKQLHSQQSSLLGDKFSAEYLMTLLQLAYWPESEVNKQLSSGRWQTIDCMQTMCKALIDDNQSLIVMQYSNTSSWQADIEIAIPAANINIKIQHLE